MSIAKQFLASFDLIAADKAAVRVQFFTRNTVYEFSDGSILYLQMYGSSYATN